MNGNIKNVLAWLIGIVVIVGGGVLLVGTASATGGGDNDPPNCEDEFITVVDEEAWDETIPGEPEVWANFSPSKHSGPFTGPPSWPNDPRGTWHVHNQIPGGHAGPDGVYQRDNPHSGRADWFYRHNGTEDQVVHHPEVTHQEPNPDYPCETPTEPTITVPTEPTEPTDDPCAPVVTEGGATFYPCDPTAPTPTDPTVTIPTDPTEPTCEPTVSADRPIIDPCNPPPEDPDVVTETRECVGDALVEKTYRNGVLVASSTVNGHPECKPRKHGQPPATHGGPGDPGDTVVAPEQLDPEEGM